MTAVAEIGQHLGAETIEKTTPSFDTDVRRVRHKYQCYRRTRLHVAGDTLIGALQPFAGEDIHAKSHVACLDSIYHERFTVLQQARAALFKKQISDRYTLLRKC